MNVVLPEIDGRIVTRAISFKAESERRDALEFTTLVHRPLPSRVDAVADLAAAWVDLRRTPAGARRIACVLSDYPAKGGRTGYAVGSHTGERRRYRGTSPARAMTLAACHRPAT